MFFTTERNRSRSRFIFSTFEKYATYARVICYLFVAIEYLQKAGNQEDYPAASNFASAISRTVVQQWARFRLTHSIARCLCHSCERLQDGVITV